MVTMTAKELVHLATLAYGVRWRTALAAACGMSREMLYRYERGRWPIPEDRAELLRDVLRRDIAKRAAACNAALIRLGSVA